MSCPQLLALDICYKKLGLGLVMVKASSNEINKVLPFIMKEKKALSVS